MKLSKYIFTLLVFSIFCLTPSCKKTGREITERLAGETTEKVAKGMAKESSEKSLRNLTRKELRSLDWDDLLKMIRKENWNLSEALSKMDGSFQKKIGKAIQYDYDFYKSLVSSKTVGDEYAIFVKSSPRAAKNIDLFRYFVKSSYEEAEFGANCIVRDLILKEETGVVKIFSKSKNTLIGNLRDGVFELKCTPSEIKDILSKDLITNIVYKFNGNNGITLLYHVDNLGRIYKVEARGIKPGKHLSDIVNIRGNVKLGSTLDSKMSQLSKTIKNDNVNASFILKYGEDETVPLTVKAEIQNKNKKLLSESFENSIKATARHLNLEGKEAIEFIAKNRPDLKPLVDKLSGFQKPNLVMEKNGDKIILRIKPNEDGAWINSVVEIEGDVIRGKAGSPINTKLNQGVNDFLHNALPNKTYEVDGQFIFKTDKYGRPVDCQANWKQPAVQHHGRGSEAETCIAKGGVQGVDDGGHIFANELGGIQESINIVPMNNAWQRQGGAWREFEKLEKQILKDPANKNKAITSSRKLVYEGSSQKPSAIVVEIKVDGKTVHGPTTMKCP